MPEVSILSHLAQLATVAGVFGGAGFAGGYCLFLRRHRDGLKREEKLYAKRIAAENATLAASREAAQQPLFNPAHVGAAPTSPPMRSDVPKPPPAVIFNVDYVPYIAPEAVTFRPTTETVLNPPMFAPAPTRRRAPSTSPLALEARPQDVERWRDLVGPSAEKLTVTDVEHLTVEQVQGRIDEVVRGRHGSFRLGTA